MAPESAVTCLKKQPDSFPRMIIQVNGHGSPIFAPNRGVAPGSGRFKKTREKGAVRNKSEGGTKYRYIIGNVGYFQFQPWLFKYLMIGILEYHGIMINQGINILVRRDDKLVRNTFCFRTSPVISQPD